MLSVTSSSRSSSTVLPSRPQCHERAGGNGPFLSALQQVGCLREMPLLPSPLISKAPQPLPATPRQVVAAELSCGTHRQGEQQCSHSCVTAHDSAINKQPVVPVRLSDATAPPPQWRLHDVALPARRSADSSIFSHSESDGDAGDTHTQSRSSTSSTSSSALDAPSYRGREGEARAPLRRCAAAVGHRSLVKAEDEDHRPAHTERQWWRQGDALLDPPYPVSGVSTESSSLSLLQLRHANGSSCGCASSCTCRTDSSASGSLEGFRAGEGPREMVVRVTPVRSQPLGQCVREQSSRTGGCAIDGSGTWASSEASSETGATPPMHVSSSSNISLSDQDGEEEHSRGRRQQHHPRRRCSERRGREKLPLNDPFLKAVRDTGFWVEAPPLLHLSYPVRTASPRGGGRHPHRRMDDAAVTMQRELEERRRSYIDGVNKWSCGEGGPVEVRPSLRSEDEAHVGHDDDAVSLSGRAAITAVDAAAVGTEGSSHANRLQRPCGGGSTVELAAGGEARGSDAVLPLLQSELACYEARSTAQLQRINDAVMVKLQSYHEEVQHHTKELVEQQAELFRKQQEEWQRQQQEQQQQEQQHRVEEGLEKAANTVVVSAAAAIATVERVDQGTSPMAADLAASEPTCTAPPLAAPPAPRTRCSVGTQYNDGSLEELVAVRAEAAAWRIDELFALERAARDSLLHCEAYTRESKLRVAEDHDRHQLLHVQEQCTLAHQSAIFLGDVRAWHLREQLDRQELKHEAEQCWWTLQAAHERHLHHLAEATTTSREHHLKAALLEAQGRLTTLEREKADVVEQSRQLRLQLLQTLRMPTVTIVDRLRVPRQAWDGVESGDAAGGGTALPPCGAAALRGVAGAGGDGALDDEPVHRRFARAHQEALRVTRAQHRTV